MDDVLRIDEDGFRWVSPVRLGGPITPTDEEAVRAIDTALSEADLAMRLASGALFRARETARITYGESAAVTQRLEKWMQQVIDTHRRVPGGAATR